MKKIRRYRLKCALPLTWTVDGVKSILEAAPIYKESPTEDEEFFPAHNGFICTLRSGNSLRHIGVIERTPNAVEKALQAGIFVQRKSQRARILAPLVRCRALERIQ